MEMIQGDGHQVVNREEDRPDPARVGGDGDTATCWARLAQESLEEIVFRSLEVFSHRRIVYIEFGRDLCC